jgi:hypothetical protein
VEMCWPRVGEANPLFSVRITLCRWTATARLSMPLNDRGISDYPWPWSVIGMGYFLFILVTLHLCLLLIHRYLWNSQKWQILISVNRDFYFFYFLRFSFFLSFFFYLETQKKYISMKNSQFFNYLLYATSK